MSGTVFCVVFRCILDISCLMVSEMRNADIYLSFYIDFFSLKAQEALKAAATSGCLKWTGTEKL